MISAGHAKGGITKGVLHKSVFCTFLQNSAQMCAFSQPILGGKNAQKRAKTRKNAQERAILLPDACDTPVYYTPVSVHPMIAAEH